MNNIVKTLQNKQPNLRTIDRLGCNLSFINYDREKLLFIQEKYMNDYIWYYEHLSQQSKNLLINENRHRYKILYNQQINNESYIIELSTIIREKLPLLKNVDFQYQFVKFDKDYILEVHTDSGRNAVMFFPLNDGGSSTDFYRNNKKIKSFEHTSPLLLSVDVPHGSHVTQEKITFQIGFTCNDWIKLLDYCRGIT